MICLCFSWHIRLSDSRYESNKPHHAWTVTGVEIDVDSENDIDVSVDVSVDVNVDDLTKELIDWNDRSNLSAMISVEVWSVLFKNKA